MDSSENLIHTCDANNDTFQVAPLDATRDIRSPSLTERAHRVAKLKSMQTTAFHAMDAVRKAYASRGSGMAGGNGTPRGGTTTPRFVPHLVTPFSLISLLWLIPILWQNR